MDASLFLDFLLRTCSVCRDFHARAEQVHQAHTDVQQLLETACSQAFINAAPGAEKMLDQQFCDSSQPW
jgi:hypothetical protein